MLTAAECLEIIRAAYPDLVIRKHVFNNTGQNNDVLIVNDDTVFRFPRTAHGARQLRVEAAVLSYLQARVTLQVPNPIYLSLGQGAGAAAPTTSGPPPRGPSGGTPAAGGSDEGRPPAWWQKPSAAGSGQNLGVQLTSWQRPLGLRARLGGRARATARPAPAPEDRPGLRGADGKLPWERGIFTDGLPWGQGRGERGRVRASAAGPGTGRPGAAGPGAGAADSSPRGAFIGYRWIPGEPLWRDLLLTIDDPRVVQGWAEQLGRFLQELHDAPLEGELAVLLPRYDSRARWADFYARVQAKVFPYMRRDARTEVARSFEGYLADPANFQHPLTLVHGDFGPGNILIDPAGLRVTGVIDFGSAGLDDPAVDLAALIGPYGYGEAFLRRFAKIYPVAPETLERARFYASTFGLQDAVYGIEHGDRQAFESGIAAYR